MTSITVESDNTKYDSRNNCNAIICKSNADSKVELVSGCKTTTIPDGVVVIGEAAFKDQTGLESITIPSSVTTIGENAFYGCNNSSFTQVTIPSNVTSIGNSAFKSCSALKTVACEATTPPTLANSVFDYCNALSTIYVPAASVSAYQGATNWSSYSGIIVGARFNIPYRYYDTSDYQFKDATAEIAFDYPVNDVNLEDGKFYVVNGNIEASVRSVAYGTVNLILADGAKLTASKGITVASGNTLNIYAQSEGTGALVATATDEGYAGIGGKNNEGFKDCGTITIHGGKVTSTGNGGGAGIGGCQGYAGGTVTIYGGTVTATGGSNAMGIGAGSGSTTNGTLTLAEGLSVLGGDSSPSAVITDGTRYQYMAVGKLPTAPTATELTYSGSAQNLLTAATEPHGTINYGTSANAETEPNSWSADVPQETDAGTYYAWYKITGDAGYLDITPQCVICSIWSVTTYGAITIATDPLNSSRKRAVIDGTSNAEVSIPSAIEVDAVTINRTFSSGVASTVFLPFGIAKSNVTGGKFYTFTSVDETKSPWEVTYTEVGDNIAAWSRDHRQKPNGSTSAVAVSVASPRRRVCISCVRPKQASKARKVKWL